MDTKPRDAVIISAVRTPTGNFLGSLSSFTAPQLGAMVINEAVNRASIDPKEVQEVIMGQVLQGGCGQAPGRQAAIGGGIPPEAGAMTINKVCGSGLKAVELAAQAIRLGDLDVIVAGGMESMSNAPYVLHGARKGFKFGDQKLKDGMILDGLWDSFNDFHMGMAAELTAEKSKLTREELDRYAYDSQMKAVKAIEGGKFKEEILSVEIPQRKGEPIIFDTDETPRANTKLERLGKLRPAFKKDGMLTAGNSPGLSDGAAAVVVMAREKAEKLGVKPMAIIRGYATGGTEPKWLFYSPVVAVKKLMAKLKMTIGDFDLIEANEAFSAQALADGKELGWDWDRVNVNGGAIALGHPIGASGTRVLVTLLYALADRSKKVGLATLCLGGGNAVAMCVELL
ncbi:MAG: acetyl-CoA acetyltransferase [candidate division Zixibacteria bacterium SM23_81]|nr:MAG: acetyl-CoA acetyltransferase [candidate division Zixibacteria bacterium SM23_81]